MGPRNSSWGSESRGGQRRQALRELGAEAAAERGGDGGPRARERREADGDVHDCAAASAGAVHVRHAVDVHQERAQRLRVSMLQATVPWPK